MRSKSKICLARQTNRVLFNQWCSHKSYGHDDTQWNRTEPLYSVQRTHTNDINLIRLLEINAIHEIIYHILCGHTSLIVDRVIIVIVVVAFMMLFLLEIFNWMFVYGYFFLFSFYWLQRLSFSFLSFSSEQCSYHLFQMIKIDQFTLANCIRTVYTFCKFSIKEWVSQYVYVGQTNVFRIVFSFFSRIFFFVFQFALLKFVGNWFIYEILRNRTMS